MIKALKLRKEEAIMIFNALENVTIKGKDAMKLAPLLDKLDKHLVTFFQKENAEKLPDVNKVTSMAQSK